MDTPDLPPGLNALPTFSSPLEDPPLPPEDPTPGQPEGSHPHHPSQPRYPTPSTPRTDRAATRTTTSSTGDTLDTGKLVAGVLAMLAVGVAAGVRMWRGRKLRQPTKGQLRDAAEPLARILLRHVDAARLNPDLADVTVAGAAIGEYLNDGPLTTRIYVDSGLPDNLQEEN